MNAVSELLPDGILPTAKSLIFPSPLPDELAHGYRGRIRMVNCHKTALNTTHSLAMAFPEEERESRRKALSAIAISKAARMTVGAFCQQHTLMPLTRMATHAALHGAIGTPDTMVLIEQSTFQLMQPSRMACGACIAEDQAFLGFSYWRRRHQLPGVAWCEKHRIALVSVAASFDECPCISSSDEENSDDTEFRQWVDHPVIERYVEIAVGLLEFRRLLPMSEALGKLSQRARQEGLLASKKGSRALLSDRAMERLPRSWLSKHIPNADRKRSCQIFTPIDGALFQECTSLPRILALALLFDTAEEALQYWHSEKIVEGSDAPVWMDAKGLSDIACQATRANNEALLAFFDGMSLPHACELHGADMTECEQLIRQSGKRFAEALRRANKSHAVAEQ